MKIQAERKGVVHMKNSSYKRIISLIISICMLFTLINVPASAIAFPCMATIKHPSKNAAQVWSLPGTAGHEADKTTTSVKLTELANGTTVRLTGEGIDGDNDKWYEIGYGDGYNSKGYVYCANVVIQAEYTEDAEFEAWLTEQGFPESYKPGLRNLHTLYPNWKFYADHTNLAFSDVVKAQNGGVNNKYVHIDSDISWKSYEAGDYDWVNNTWKGYDGSSWIGTTDRVIAYYVDPRNFLDARNIFMFASEKFIPEKEDIDFIKNAVKGTFMDAELPDATVDPENPEVPKRTYADAILAAAQRSGVSAATIIALIRQEQGTRGTGNCISGVYYTDKYPTELKGYYNFFNIGAYAHSGRNAIENGLIWAKGGSSNSTTYNRPWDTREKSIIGGAEWYGNNYVSVGQDTIYYKNFNVYKNTTHELYTHQYATNIEDCTGKGSNMADAMDFLADGEIVFHIPIFKNMPEQTTLPTKGTNNNRFLESLSIKGYEDQFGSFDRYTYSYEAIVPHSVEKINILATPSAKDATVSGVGEVELEVGNNELKVTVTSSTGLTGTYTLTVYREKAPVGEALMPELNTQYKVDYYMTNIQPDTDIATFKTNLGVTNGRAVVMNYLGNEKVTGFIATGDTVHLYDAHDKIRVSYPVIIYGDVDGNGRVTSVDLLVGQKHILKQRILDTIYLKALDMDHNSSVNSVDLLVGQRHILKIKPLVQ